MEERKIAKLITALTVIVLITSLGVTIILLLMGLDVNAEIREAEATIERLEASTTSIEKQRIPIKTEVIEEEEDFGISEEEMEMMARIVMNEASIVRYEGKLSVAVTMVNRFKDGRWGETMTEVLNYPNAYSHIRNGEISEDCREAVKEAIEYYGAFPGDLLYFRADRYHDFGYPYMEIDNLYFTTEENYEAVQ